MNLWNKIRDSFHKPPPPPAGLTLRNKPGGMAWIRGIEELRGRIVTTVSADARGFWVIDPPQRFTVSNFAVTLHGQVVPPGTPAVSVSIVDHCLEPIREVGEGERDESLAWLPPVPTVRKEPERA
jgi:hypothetical protein